MNRSQVSVSSPEVLWHGGGNENGKPDPVYSVDFHPLVNIMCTTGIDASVPPKGSVRIWRVSADQEGQEFVLDLCDHQSAVNVARFSPDGKMLASASDRQIVVYTVPDANDWTTIDEANTLERIWLRPSLNEIFDLQWSPDSTHLAIGAIDCKGEIIRISNRDSVILPGHTSYIQGVAWDPLGEHVVTQSADRSCKVHRIKSKPSSTVKVAGKGHVVMRMQLGFNIPDSEKKVLTAADFGLSEDNVASGSAGNNADNEKSSASTQSANLFADSFVPSFFRRVSWSPDGALVIAPTGIHRPPASVAAKTAAGANSYCTHLFSRSNLSSPCVSLVGLEEPSVAVRCCPRPYKLVPHPTSSGSENADAAPASMIPGKYRFVFAVVTLGSVFVYDTQHAHPIAKFSGLHYAPINDCAWSADGRVLAACSSDGYLSFFRFEEGALGQLLPDEEVPVEIKRAFSCLFQYTPPAPVAPEIGHPESGLPATATAAPTVTALSSPKQAESNDAASVSSREGDESGKAKLAAGPTDAASAAEARVVTAVAPVEADFAAETKKRKRIQPMVVVPLPGTSFTTSTAAGSSSSSNNSASASSAAAPSGEAGASSSLDTATAREATATASAEEVAPATTTAHVGADQLASPRDLTAVAGDQKPAKKRIAPQLVQG